MTTAAQALVALSGLSGVAASAHLLSIQAGGAAQTVFASRFTVVTGEQQTVITRKVKRLVPTDPGAATQPAVIEIRGQREGAYVRTSPEAAHVFTADEVIYITTRTRPLVTTTRFDTAVATRKKRISTQQLT